jgi:hypothetical protein
MRISKSVEIPSLSEISNVQDTKTVRIEISESVILLSLSASALILLVFLAIYH